MALFHINTETGNAGKCSATQGKCPFGSADNHFSSEEAARAAFEANHSTFAQSEKDLSTMLPEWHGKITSALERKIAKKWAEDSLFLAGVKSGTIETKFENIEEFLSPPIYAIRDRGTWFVPLSEVTGEPDEMFAKKFGIGISTRQGGGNRECYCEEYDSHESYCLAVNNDELSSHPQYVRDADDDFDNTYATFYFSGDFTEADVAKSKEQQQLASKARLIETRQKEITDGVKPPWSILADSSESSAAFSTYASEQRKFAATEKSFEAKKENSALATEALKLVSNKKSLTKEEGEKIALLAGYQRYSAYRFESDIKNFRDSTKTLAKAEAMVSQAEAIPDGELKEYLLGDRGIGHYNVEEKVGRRKTTVRKEYQRGSVLGEKLKEANRVHDSNTKTLKEPLEKLALVAKEADTLAAQLAASKKPLEDARAAAWAQGWSGPKDQIPPVGENF